MAQLPPDGQILIQQIGEDVIIFDRYTEEEFHRFNPNDANGVAIKMGELWHNEKLTDEQRCFAIFWSGYFYAHARN